MPLEAGERRRPTLPKGPEERFLCAYFGDDVRGRICVERQAQHPSNPGALRPCCTGKCDQGRAVAAKMEALGLVAKPEQPTLVVVATALDSRPMGRRGISAVCKEGYQREWGRRTAQGLDALTHSADRHRLLTFLAPALYCDLVIPYLTSWSWTTPASWRTPLRGLGIGEQRAKLGRLT